MGGQLPTAGLGVLNFVQYNVTYINITLGFLTSKCYACIDRPEPETCGQNLGAFLHLFDS